MDRFWMRCDESAQVGGSFSHPRAVKQPARLEKRFKVDFSHLTAERHRPIHRRLEQYLGFPVTKKFELIRPGDAEAERLDWRIGAKHEAGRRTPRIRIGYVETLHH